MLNNFLIYEKDCTQNMLRYGHSTPKLASGGPYLMHRMKAVQDYAKVRIKSVSNQDARSLSPVFYSYPVNTEHL